MRNGRVGSTVHYNPTEGETSVLRPIQMGRIRSLDQHRDYGKSGEEAPDFSGPDATWGLLQRDVKSIRQLAHRQ